MTREPVPFQSGTRSRDARAVAPATRRAVRQFDTAGQPDGVPNGFSALTLSGNPITINGNPIYL